MSRELGVAGYMEGACRLAKSFVNQDAAHWRWFVSALFEPAQREDRPGGAISVFGRQEDNPIDART